MRSDPREQQEERVGEGQVLSMENESAVILGHVSNIGVVQTPGRRYPGVVVQGDSLHNMLGQAIEVARELKRFGSEEAYFKALDMVSKLRGQRMFYEETLERLSKDLEGE